MYRGFRRKPQPQPQSLSVPLNDPTELMMLVPGTSTRGSNVEDWMQRAQAYVGKSSPGVKRFFTQEKAIEGRKHFSMDLTDVQVVQPLTREEENALSTTQVKEHEWKMTDSREKLKEQTLNMKKAYTVIAAHISTDSWKAIDVHLQSIQQKGTQDEYWGVANENFDIASLKEAEQPLELLTVIINSHRKHQFTVPILAQANSFLKMLDVRPIGTVDHHLLRCLETLLLE